MPPVFTVHPTDTNASAQGSVTLSCSVAGFPRPQLMWLKDGIPLRDIVIVSNGSTVRSMVYLVRLNISDSASYVCRAVNTLATVQQVESAPGYLQVQCKCVVFTRKKENVGIICFCIAVPPSLKVGLQNLTKNESDWISYFCQFTGLPSPQVRWIRVNTLNETEELDNSVTRTSIATVRHDREPELGAVNSTLEITNLEKSDEGQYVCTGINRVDNLIDAINYSTAYLTIQGCFSHCLCKGCVFTFSFPSSSPSHCGAGEWCVNNWDKRQKNHPHLQNHKGFTRCCIGKHTVDLHKRVR